MERTGPHWVSYQSAAKKLGVTIIEIEALVEGHLVRSIQDGETKFVSENDIDDLDHLKHPISVDPLKLSRSIALIEQRLNRIEEALNLLFEASRFTSFKMHHLEDDTLMELTANVEQMLDQPEWPLPRLLSCAEVFIKLSEVEVERLKELLGDPNPWRPFLELCLKQLHWLARNASALPGYEWARAKDLLHQGFGNLKQLALCYCSLNQDVTALYEVCSSSLSLESSTLDYFVLKNTEK